MDSKGIDIQGVYPQLPVQLRTERRSAVAIRPVEKSGSSEMKSLLDQDRGGAGVKGPFRHDDVEAARLATALLSAEIGGNKDLEVKWTVNQDSGILVVEVKDRSTGEILRQIPPEEILAGNKAGESSGVLLNKTA